MALVKRTYVDGETIITAQNLNDIQDEIISHANTFVPKTRTINSKALDANITLTASDLGAVPTTRTVNSKALSSNITLTAADVSAVPTTRTVNSKALSSNITLTSGDIGYSSSTTYTSGTIGAAVSDLNGAINAITPLDTTPTSGSAKGITSGAVDSAISKVSEKHEITLSNKVTTNITAFAVNGIGYINFGFNNQNIPTTAYWTTMATLESDYRPSAERYFNTLIIMDGVSEVHVGRITTGGNIDINHLNGEHTISSIRATIPYII